tara:strand:+ start:2187 stop:3053 length:867 start_codon:yes stop_codon:yes gene_type:complete
MRLHGLNSWHDDSSLFTARQLDFDGSRRAQLQKEEGMTLCAMVGVVVVLYYFMTVHLASDARAGSAYSFGAMGGVAESAHARAVSGCDQVRGMVSKLSAAVSAKHSAGKDKDVFTHNAADYYDEVKTLNPIALVEKHIGREVQTAQKMTQDDKERCKTALRNYLDQNDRVIILLFAPWCQHCKHLMPNFAASLGDRKAIMVNGDSMPEDIMSGKSWFPKVEYFPLLVVHRGGEITLTNSPEEAVTHYDKPIHVEEPSVNAKQSLGHSMSDPAPDPQSESHDFMNALFS